MTKNIAGKLEPVARGGLKAAVFGGKVVVVSGYVPLYLTGKVLGFNRFVAAKMLEKVKEGMLGVDYGVASLFDVFGLATESLVSAAINGPFMAMGGITSM